MNRIHSFLMLIAFIVLCCSFSMSVQAQTPSPSPTPETTPTKEESADPFAPEKAPSLPAGMTGSNADDPRTKLSPGMYNAGEASMGLKHLLLLKQPDAFQLGTPDHE